MAVIDPQAGVPNFDVGQVAADIELTTYLNLRPAALPAPD